jgi:hypothetical protein
MAEAYELSFAGSDMRWYSVRRVVLPIGRVILPRSPPCTYECNAEEGEDDEEGACPSSARRPMMLQHSS